MDKYNIDGHKMQYHAERVAQWQSAKTIEQKLQVYPIYVEISPVGQCNHRCTFCAVDYIGYVNRTLSTHFLDNALIDMASHGVKSIMLAGEGEPMLHPDIEKIVELAKFYGLDVGFTTNGTMMDDKFIDVALEDCSFIKVSLNAGNEDIYAKIHQVKKAHFEMVWLNIKNAVARKKEAKLDVAIGVQCLLLPDNMDSIRDLAIRCQVTGVDYLVLKPYSQSPNSITQKYSQLQYNHDYDRVISEAMNFVSSDIEVIARTSTMEDYDANERGYGTCHSTPFLWAYIMATGDVYACSAHLLDDRFNLGNINDNSFSEIWAGEKRKKLIEEMQTFDISTCRKNCRMNKVNKYLWDITNPQPHGNFI
jgi:cyclic pyranopterin phosphate synthase